MPKTAYRCPACQNEVDRVAVVCSNPTCRRELAFCSHCLDVTTCTLVTKKKNRLGRDQYRCDRCQGACVKCVTWLAGGYCNGLARAGRRWSSPLCVHCFSSARTVARSAATWALMAAASGMLKRRK